MTISVTDVKVGDIIKAKFIHFEDIFVKVKSRSVAKSFDINDNFEGIFIYGDIVDCIDWKPVGKEFRKTYDILDDIEVIKNKGRRK